jgi:hypothetical protein
MADYRLHPITWKNVIDYNWLQLQITSTPCLFPNLDPGIFWTGWNGIQAGSRYILIGILFLSRESRWSLVGFQSEFRYILPGFIRDAASFSGNPGIFESKSRHIPVGSQYILTGIYIGIPLLSRESRNCIPVESSGIPIGIPMGSQFHFLLEYIEYLMYFFHCQETRRLVSIFKYIDAMLLNLDPDIVRSGPRLHSTCSKQHGGSASSSADVTRIILRPLSVLSLDVATSGSVI